MALNNATEQRNNNQSPNRSGGATGRSPNNPSPNQMANNSRAGQGGRRNPPSGQRNSNPSPGNPMTMRRFDMEPPQSASSNAMRVTVDKWAGSFEGQQRRKLEIAIAPEIARFSAHLKRAEKRSRSVLDDLADGVGWRARHHRDVTSAEGEVRKAQAIVSSLRGRTRGTPYAFVGLQMVDISTADLTPAREHFWASHQTEAGTRVDSVRAGWQKVRRAIDRLDRLIKRFEAARQENALADRAQRVKTMYRVFVEDSFTRLGLNPGEASKHQRKLIEFELDDEYLERLQEVLKMRHELLAELARMLDDDPRLLRRFMNNFQDRTDSLRLQLTKLRERQQSLEADSVRWAGVNEADRDRVLSELRASRLAETGDLARSAGDIADRFDAWLPLEDIDGNAQVDAARNAATRVAALGQDMARTAEGGETDAALAQARELYDALRAFELAMRRLGSDASLEGVDEFAVRRILSTRALVVDVSSWIRRVTAIQSGEFHSAAAIEQYQLATETDQLAGKLGDVEQQLAGLLQGEGGLLPSKIAESSRELLKKLDELATPNQLGAAIAMQQPAWPRATQRQAAAAKALTDAGQLFDELIAGAIEELDKLPVQDPIASLLDDPTLDEILAELESETDLAEQLGIPRPRSNLRIIGDWLRPGQQGGGGGGRSMLASQIRAEMQRMNRLANRMKKDAEGRIQSQVAKSAPAKRRKSPEKSDWNKLVSELGEGLLQGRDKLPPKRYRSAIQQYYEIINRQVTEGEPSP